MRTRRVGPVLVLLLVLASCSGSPSDVTGGAAGSVTDAPTAAGQVADDPTPSTAPVAPTTESSSSASSSSPDGARPATPSDAAAFLASARPAGVERLLGIAVDLDGDEQREVVLHGVRDGVGWLGVAVWDGTAYDVVTEVEAGPARRTDDLRVADVNLDGDLELVLATSGEGAASLALWAARRPDRLVPLEAVGGCADGSNVFGVIGAELVGDEGGLLDVVASCDDSPLPVADWSQDRWTWVDGAYRHVEDAAPEPGDDVVEEPRPSPTPVRPQPTSTPTTTDGAGE